MLEMVRGDVHPPLYFLLAHYWIRITPGDVLDAAAAAVGRLRAAGHHRAGPPVAQARSAAHAAVVSGAVDLFSMPVAVFPHGAILQLAGFGIHHRRAGPRGAGARSSLRGKGCCSGPDRSRRCSTRTMCRGSRPGPARTCCCCRAGACASQPSAGGKRDRPGGLPALAHDARIDAGGLAGETRPAADHRQRLAGVGHQAGLLDLLFLLWRSDSGVDASR